MATIFLQAAGGLIGGLVGGPFGAMAGRALGAFAGSAVDQRVFGQSRTRSVEGARLKAGRFLDAEEGAGIARLYGTARLAGQVIWTTRFEERRTTERHTSGGGKGGGGRAASTTEVVTYSYFGNVAIGLCEGPVAHVRRIWADGEEMDLTGVTVRVHHGTEDQMPDPLIEARQGQGNAPAYRGLAYVVFERLPLERWGNRIPQIACEVIRPIGELEANLRAITIIPAATEHGLDTRGARERLRAGEDRLMNRNVRHDGNDFSASLGELTALCPRLERAALVVSWFADDSRAGSASVRPGVEVAQRDETIPWSVSGLSRAEARLVSRSGGSPAYGGTPSDAGVLRAIGAMKGRGLKVTLYPFLMMDVPEGSGRPDPYGGETQPAYPWRGRMTLSTAPGLAGSPDGTALARTEIARFVGTARGVDFTRTANWVTYRGPAEWSYRRMILHYAHLARAAGGVDAFVIGSEMRGLTRLRDGEGRFPFVEALIELARDVKAILPDALVTYAADWSEYFGYQPADGSGDVFYNLDPLWADEAVGAVGIDSYLPLADWRSSDRQDGGPDGIASPYDRRGLSRDIAGGEYFDWYYASEADRRARQRTPIADGAAGKPWVFRPKDLKGWWENRHVERRGGVETGPPTAWVPRSKPIWLTELGCPAIDKGANQPNVFLDPKSAESRAPYFSTGARDDHGQRRFLETHLRHWEGGEEGNPLSPLYGGRMVEEGAVHLWTWDARPFPAFPERRDIWADGGNWERGHWLTGRLGKAPLDRLIAAILSDHGIADFDVEAVEGEVGGFVLSGPGSARGEIEALMQLAGLSAASSAGRLVFSTDRSARPAGMPNALADEGEGALIELRRAEASESVDEVLLHFSDPARAYQNGTASAAFGRAGRSARQTTFDLPVTLADVEAQRFASELLAANLGGRETARFALSPSELGLEAGDIVALPNVPGRWRIERIEDGLARRMEARQLPLIAAEAPPATAGSESPVTRGPVFASRPVVHFLDLPLLGQEAGGARVAVFARPWLPYAALAAVPGAELSLRAAIDAPARCGRLAEPLLPGPEGRLDHAARLLVDMDGGALFSIARPALLGGGNAAAIRAKNGTWEVIQFESAEEVEPGRFVLTGLLRAQGGTDDAMRAGADEGADFVLLDEALMPAGITRAESGAALDWRIVPAGRGLDDDGVHGDEATLGNRAERPLSPVHLRGAFAADGALDLTWIRRSRIDADRWDGIEVPLGEEMERYRVTVGAGDEMRIVAEVGEPSLAISAAEQASAFGALPAILDVAVSQIGLTAGPGTARETRLVR